MEKLCCFGNELQHLCGNWCKKVTSISKSFFFLSACFCRFILRSASPLWVQIFYFVSLSFMGFGFLKVLKPRIHSFTPSNLDLFFTSVSATTVSSMSTVEMEVFSNAQLIIITILMFIGGEIFTSMVGLQFIRSRLKTELDKIAASHSRLTSPSPIILDQIELSVVQISDPDSTGPKPKEMSGSHESLTTNKNVRYLSMKYLGFVILFYLIVIHVIGVVSVSIYFAVIPSAKEVLQNKGLKMFTFCVFTIVSTFASCGFIPTNENMVVFRKNSGLLLMLIPQVLLGNTLFPPCLRFSIWVLGKFYKKKESRYLLENTKEVGYKHLLPRQYSVVLVATVLGFIVVQMIVFNAMDWNMEGLKGMNGYEKFVGVFFQTVNSRHTGESIVDLSTVSQAILVLFVLMMYLPPYTSFHPKQDEQQGSESCERTKKNRGNNVLDISLFSQLSYLVIFIILVCITERKKLKDDPLNFNVLNIVVEVVSAYGNVGFSTGYSCERELHPEPNCQDKWIGFVGKWSDEGKIILIIVMFFGRLKKFNMDGGKLWKLL